MSPWSVDRRSELGTSHSGSPTRRSLCRGKSLTLGRLTVIRRLFRRELRPPAHWAAPPSTPCAGQGSRDDVARAVGASLESAGLGLGADAMTIDRYEHREARDRVRARFRR